MRALRRQNKSETAERVVDLVGVDLREEELDAKYPNVLCGWIWCLEREEIRVSGERKGTELMWHRKASMEARNGLPGTLQFGFCVQSN